MLLVEVRVTIWGCGPGLVVGRRSACGFIKKCCDRKTLIGKCCDLANEEIRFSRAPRREISGRHGRVDHDRAGLACSRSRCGASPRRRSTSASRSRYRGQSQARAKGCARIPSGFRRHSRGGGRRSAQRHQFPSPKSDARRREPAVISRDRRLRERIGKWRPATTDSALEG